ncbi:nitroreductase/quinone reductase family protein [Gordonia zhaorongruii]|uniref:nitroreductase/quinone reductase family protein n=1 Tax=Gordonia zhaorongruii TaxID=2597659 RepID=UPI00104F542D|nr:nitroreductase/quinone reductase family protein [Gordonia zhaorongruii]
MSAFQRVAKAVNTLVTPMLSAPVVGPFLGRSMTEITYTGRRSGRQIMLPVAYRMRGDDEVVIGVAMPDRKSWWRNFEGDPQPVSIVLDGATRTGTGLAEVSEKGTAVIISLNVQTR